MNRAFSKYQEGELLRLVNTEAGRRLLGIKDKFPIIKITPNSFHQYKGTVDKRDLIQGRFFNSDRISEIFAPILEKIIIAGQQDWKTFRTIQENSYEAFLHYSNLESRNYKYPSIFLITDVFNTSHEGHIEQANATWATAHDAASGTFAVNSGTCLCNFAASTYTIDRYGADFNTTAIADTAVITAGTVRIFFVATNAANVNSTTFDIVGFTPADPAVIVGGDYDQFGTTVFATINLASITDAAYNTFTLDANGRANISVTGYSSFGFRIGRDTANSAPTGNNRHDFQDRTGANPCDLNVTYTVPTAGAGARSYAYLM